jgi:predicted site-specific integrase-resolvase
MTSHLDTLWDAETLAEHLGVPARTLGQWRYRGEGPPYVKAVAHIRYRPEDVDAWLAAQTRGGQPVTA